MKNKLLLTLVLSLCILGLFAPAAYSQTPTYTCTITNDSLVGSNIYEFDIYLLRTGTTPMELGGAQFGFLFNDSIKNGGTLTASYVPGSVDTAIVNSGQTNSAFNATVAGCIKIAAKLPSGGPGKGAQISNVAPGTRVGRLRLTNSVALGTAVPNIKYSFSTTPYATKLSVYIAAINTDITDSTKFFNNLKYRITGVQPETVLPSSFEVYQNYPNPFNPSTTIRYALPSNGQVRITLYNTLGQLVKEIYSGYKQSGYQEVNFNASGLPSGVYIYSIHVTSLDGKQNYSSAKKMMLLK
jgi:hypothetical protein